MALGTRWVWRDIAYRRFSGLGPDAPGYPNTVIPKNYPFPTPRSPFWWCWNAVYAFTPTTIDLIFWTDTWFPSVQLIARRSEPDRAAHYKIRRGVIRNCGDDWYIQPPAVAYDLNVYASYYPESGFGCPGSDDMSAHAAYIPVWRSDTGFLPPFDEPLLWCGLKQARLDMGMPGSWDTFSSAFNFLHERTDLEEALADFPNQPNQSLALWPILPPDLQWRTRRFQPSKRGNPDLPPALPQPLYSPHTWVDPLWFLERPWPACISNCGLNPPEKPLNCNLDPNPPPLHIAFTIYRNITVRDRHGTHSVQVFGPNIPYDAVARAESGVVECDLPLIGAGDGCDVPHAANSVRSFYSACWPTPLPSPFSNLNRIIAIRPADGTNGDTNIASQDLQGFVPALNELALYTPASNFPPPLYQTVWSPNRVGLSHPQDCTDKIFWTFQTDPLDLAVYLGPLRELSCDGSQPDFYEQIGFHSYNFDLGPVNVVFYCPSSFCYWTGGGLGVPNDPLGPLPSLLADPRLIVLGFTPPP